MGPIHVLNLTHSSAESGKLTLKLRVDVPPFDGVGVCDLRGALAVDDIGVRFRVPVLDRLGRVERLRAQRRAGSYGFGVFAGTDPTTGCPESFPPLLDGAPMLDAPGVSVVCGIGHMSSCSLPWSGNASAGGFGLRPRVGIFPSSPPRGSSVSCGSGSAMSLIWFGGSLRPPADAARNGSQGPASGLPCHQPDADMASGDPTAWRGCEASVRSETSPFSLTVRWRDLL